MSFPWNILGGLVKPITDLIDDMHMSGEEKAEAKQKLLETLQAHDQAIFQAQASIIRAEAESKHWVTAAWRPCLMLTFTAIIINNYILAPYMSAMFNWSCALSLPPEMWDLLKIGMGGYIVGRSGEKVIKEWKK